MPTAEPLTPRRRQLLEAATEVVAEHGLRGLTHRAVDRRAGLPEGSCSAYLRTRQSLQNALGGFVGDQLTEDVRALSGILADSPGDVEASLAATRSLFLDWLHDSSVLVAKLELTLEASRDPGLAELFGTWREDLVGLVTGVLTTAGRDNSQAKAEALVAALDGVLMGALLQDHAVRSDYLTTCLGTLLAPVVQDN